MCGTGGTGAPGVKENRRLAMAFFAGGQSGGLLAETKRPRTFGDLVDAFGEKSFAVVFIDPM
jgi:hypothetical protein